jgi:quercetin dioxygenase-like cupin family protein
MRIDWKTIALTATVITTGAAYADKKAEYNIVPAGTAKFAPADPKMPAGPQVSIVSGDPKTGPVTLFLKLPKGPAPIHWHTSDYSAVILEGKAKHWLPGKEADAKEVGPGTAWFQPGGSAKEAHGDECLTDSCLVFIVMPKKFDFTVVPAKTDTKPPAKK